MEMPVQKSESDADCPEPVSLETPVARKKSRTSAISSSIRRMFAQRADDQVNLHEQTARC